MDGGDALIEALSRWDAESDLGHVEPSYRTSVCSGSGRQGPVPHGALLTDSHTARTGRSESYGRW